MANTPTNRLSLQKQAGPDFISLSTLNDNLDNIDLHMGARVVPVGTIIPNPELYDGQLVMEKGGGKIYITEKNVGGTFDNRPVVDGRTGVTLDLAAPQAGVTNVELNWGSTVAWTASNNSGDYGNLTLTSGTTQPILLTKAGVYVITARCVASHAAGTAGRAFIAINVAGVFARASAVFDNAASVTAIMVVNEPTAGVPVGVSTYFPANHNITTGNLRIYKVSL